MAEYTPKTWQCGETITAEDLNHLEQGVANAGGGDAPLIVTFTQREATAEECESGGAAFEFSHSWQEIRDALAQGRRALMVLTSTLSYDEEVNQYCILTAIHENDEYHILAVGVKGTNPESVTPPRVHPAGFTFPDANSNVMVVCTPN